MPAPHDSSEFDALAALAYDTFADGDLAEAREHFKNLLAYTPENPDFHYMQGLICKYLGDWRESLTHNLRSQSLRDEHDEASAWNAAIAATALRDWDEARRQWRDCGIAVPGNEGAIEGDFGTCCVRLNPWDGGEVVYARRIDPVRARLLNVPLPQSGYRYGDIVLHDGASTGRRALGESWTMVFNAMQRMEISPFATFAVFVFCPLRQDLDDLLNSSAPDIGLIEDWTDTVKHYCLRCSYGSLHRNHDHRRDEAWQPERNLGIAAQSRHSVNRLLLDWQKGGNERQVDAVQTNESTPSSPPFSGRRWWVSPNGEEDIDDVDADKD